MRKRAKSPPKGQTKFEVMDRLLHLYGIGAIDKERFQQQMRGKGFEQEDIDLWCDQHYAKEATKNA